MLQVEITYRVAWRRSTSGNFCDNTTISSNSLVTGEGSVECINGCSGTVISQLSYFCASFSVADDFTLGGRTVSYDFTTIKTTDEITIGYTGCCWISPFGGWSLLTRFSVARRSDTGKVNSTPRTNAAPTIRIQEGCNQTIAIGVSDPDGDTVRCRWASGSECSSVCNALPGAILDQNTCTISYFANQGTGFKAAAITLEDFTSAGSSQPLSSVGLQFLVFVFSSTDPCAETPIEITSTPPTMHPCLKVRRFSNELHTVKNEVSVEFAHAHAWF